jgi:hypothetical protein
MKATRVLAGTLLVALIVAGASWAATYETLLVSAPIFPRVLVMYPGERGQLPVDCCGPRSPRRCLGADLRDAAR